MATLAQNESKKTSQRVKAGLRIAFQNGIFMGSHHKFDTVYFFCVIIDLYPGRFTYGRF